MSEREHSESTRRPLQPLPDDHPTAPGQLAYAGRAPRGGYSLFVPESYTSDRKWPLIVALHGGSGHGANFLWSWLRDARAHGCLLASATSRDRTWSLREADKDGVGLNRMPGQISERHNIDSSRLLLTGISDGGTYSMLLAAGKQSPFTHYAPVAAAVHAHLHGSRRARLDVRC